MAYPKDFVWGVAAASYQIEGAAGEDGKGPSVWDAFSHQPGAVYGGHTGDVACDHYHRYREDIAMMKKLGVKAYRLSISWPRVLPEGVGASNEKGLTFYDRVIDELLSAGITPWIVAFHWDYPYALYLRGGWLNPDSPQWFTQYVNLLMERYSDRVRHWFTILEPACFIGLGLQTGEHAPGLRLDFKQVLQAGHNALLAHGKAVQVIRAKARRPATVSLVACGEKYIPLTDTPADIEAARNLTFTVRRRNCFQYSWWMDPVVFGRYPEDGLRLYGHDAPHIAPGDMETIRQPLDVCAFNYYSAKPAKMGEDGQPVEVPRPPGYPMTTQNEWAIAPEGLYYQPKFFYERYKLPIAITENGHQNNDHVMLDGCVHDPQRVDYIHRHLLALERAIDEGVPVQGYFHWTLMDNFEWALGYKTRVGLIHTDYQTQKRTWKDSAFFYQRVIRTEGRSLHENQGAPR